MFLETNFGRMEELWFQFGDGGVMFPTQRRRLAKNRDVNVQPSQPKFGHEPPFGTGFSFAQ